MGRGGKGRELRGGKGRQQGVWERRGLRYYVTLLNSMNDTHRRTYPQTYRPTDPQTKWVLEKLSLLKIN